LSAPASWLRVSAYLGLPLAFLPCRARLYNFASHVARQSVCSVLRLNLLTTNSNHIEFPERYPARWTGAVNKSLKLAVSAEKEQGWPVDQARRLAAVLTDWWCKDMLISTIIILYIDSYRPLTVFVPKADLIDLVLQRPSHCFSYGLEDQSLCGCPSHVFRLFLPFSTYRRPICHRRASIAIGLSRRSCFSPMRSYYGESDVSRTTLDIS
jgi:hypothetical protein